MPERRIEKLVDDTLKSFDNIQRAEPGPFLFTRVMAAIKQPAGTQNIWTKLGAYISRPGIATAGVVLILILNLTIFFANRNNDNTAGAAQINSLTRDEFAIVAIYDIENPEP